MQQQIPHRLRQGTVSTNCVRMLSMSWLLSKVTDPLGCFLWDPPFIMTATCADTAVWISSRHLWEHRSSNVHAERERESRDMRDPVIIRDRKIIRQCVVHQAPLKITISACHDITATSHYHQSNMLSSIACMLTMPWRKPLASSWRQKWTQCDGASDWPVVRRLPPATCTPEPVRNTTAQCHQSPCHICCLQ